MPNKDGGFAFPQTQAEWRDSDGGLVHEVTGGMTLRDYFAARAIAGLLAAGGMDLERAARKSYDVAEAMLRNREVE